MSKLSPQEKAYNDWWMARFDSSHYKTITLSQHGKEVQTYTTANADYSDEEYAEDALFTAKSFGVDASSVSVDGTRFKAINGRVRRIANVKS